MKNIINLLLLLVLIAFTSCEPEPINTGTIYGMVTDYATGEPIKNAGVTLMPIGYTTITGSEGQFQFDNLEPRTYQLMIQKTGYEILTTTNLQLSLGATIPQNLQMTVMPPSLKVLDDKRNPIDALSFYATLEDDNVRLFNILNDGVEDLNWEILYNSKCIKSIKPQSGVLKTTETVGVVVELDRSLITESSNMQMSIHILTDNGSKELSLFIDKSWGQYYLAIDFDYNGNRYTMAPEKKDSVGKTIVYYAYEASKYCDELEYDGYTDWEIPSESQFKAFRKEIIKQGGEYDGGYWTMKDYNHSVQFSDMSRTYLSTGESWPDESVLNIARVRCVRKE